MFYAHFNSNTYCSKLGLKPMISRLWITVGKFVAVQYVILETKLRPFMLCNYTTHFCRPCSKRGWLFHNKFVFALSVMAIFPNIPYQQVHRTIICPIIYIRTLFLIVYSCRGSIWYQYLISSFWLKSKLKQNWG